MRRSTLKVLTIREWTVASRRYHASGSLFTFLDNLRLPTRIGLRLIPARRCGRVAEGGGLLNR
jgi:hypothetical protein